MNNYLERRKQEIADCKRELDLELIRLSDDNLPRIIETVLIEANEITNDDYVICFDCKNVIGQRRLSYYARFNICRICKTIDGTPIDGTSNAEIKEKPQVSTKPTKAKFCEANKMRGFLPLNCQETRVTSQRFGTAENGTQRLFNVCGNCNFQLSKQGKTKR